MLHFVQMYDIICFEVVNNKEDEGLIKKSLRIIRDIAVNVAGGVISSGIIALLGTLPIA